MKISSQIMGLALKCCHKCHLGNLRYTQRDYKGGAWKVQLLIKGCQGTVAEARN